MQSTRIAVARMLRQLRVASFKTRHDNGGHRPAQEQSTAIVTRAQNQRTLKMTTWLALVATPKPVYVDAIEQRSKVFLARTKQERETHLGAMRSPELRHSIGESSRWSVQRRCWTGHHPARLLVDVQFGQPLAGAGAGAGAGAKRQCA